MNNRHRVKCMSSHRSNEQSLEKKGNAVCSGGSEGLELHKDFSAGEKYFEIFVVAVLFCFGVYHSILYFGHQPVPHFDFNCFALTGHELLSFQVPSSFKRVPLVGILQVLLGKIAGGRSPDFTGGLLLNALLHPLNAVLLFLVGRRVVGKAAVWIAVIAIINPWVLQLLTEAIVETTLLFGILATFYFIFKRSNYSYLFASITTMVRYEGAALILAAFVMDIIQRESRREKVIAFLYSAAASVPLGLWMLVTVINWQSQGSTYYLRELGAASGGKIVLVEYINLVWQVGFYPLFTPLPTMARGAFDIFFGVSKILAAGSFVFGCCYGLYKRQWNILALLIFFVPYIFVHALHSFMFHRFCMPVFWIPLLVCFYGLCGLWELINKNNRVPRPVVLILQGVVLIIVFCWTAMLLPYLPKMADMSRRSVSLPHVAIGVVCLILAARIFIYRFRYLRRDIVTSVLTVLVIVSNQFVLVEVVGNGERDIEFKYLVDWYVANAKPGEKLVSTVPIILQTMAPEYKECFVHTSSIEGDNPVEFVQGCYKQNITYVVWDSRMGLAPNDRYYTFWHMKNIVPLERPQSMGPYEFITQLRANQRRFVNVFRLHRPEEQVPPKS